MASRGHGGNSIGTRVPDLPFLKHLRVEGTKLANVWRVSLPWQPWKVDRAVQERNTLVDHIGEGLPYRALWLSDWASGDLTGRWVLGPDDTLLSQDDRLSQGGWALFFFAVNPGTALAPLPSLPSDAEGAPCVVRDIGAGLGIFSWFDDNEWLVAKA